MPHSRLIHVLEQLAFLNDVVERRMFGGYGLYLHGFFFGLIDSAGVFYLRVDPANREEFLTVGNVAFQPDPKKKPMNYFSVPDEVLATAGQIQPWVKRAVELAHLAKKTK